MSKNEARHWIDQKHPNVLTDTKAEREMKSILEDLRITFLQDQHTNIEALNRKGIIQSFRFQLDFVLAPKEPYWVEVIEVNGPDHKRSKDEWQSKNMLGAYTEGRSEQIFKGATK